MTNETFLDCGHQQDAGMPANVSGKTIQGWRFVVLDDWRKVCHACADAIVLDCGHLPSPHGPYTTGYGRDARGKKHCYACCAEMEKARMIETGRATLYLSGNKIADWPGTLSFPCRVKRGAHNIARYRYDAWFTGPDGKPWHGVQYGDNTQIIHCRRVRG